MIKALAVLFVLSVVISLLHTRAMNKKKDGKQYTFKEVFRNFFKPAWDWKTLGYSIGLTAIVFGIAFTREYATVFGVMLTISLVVVRKRQWPVYRR